MIVYKITNKITGMVYIGQTTMSLAKRWNDHCSKKSTCSFLKNAIQKYGKCNFIVEEIDGANSLSELNYLEMHYIHINNSLAPNGYNLRTGGENSLHTEESKNKMRKPKSESAILNMKAAHKNTRLPKSALENSVAKRIGKKLSKEHKDKCSKALKGRIITEQHRKRISEALKKSWDLKKTIKL